MKESPKIVVFDMDGTIANLYGVSDWLSKLQAEDASPYEKAEPLVDMEKLNEVCVLLRQAGWEIQIISALAKDASPEYKKAIRAAKKVWLNKWGFIYDKFHGVDYKTPKCEVLRHTMPMGLRVAKMCDEYRGENWMPEAVLVDDEIRHLNRWGWGRTIDPNAVDIIEALKNLLPEDIVEG